MDSVNINGKLIFKNFSFNIIGKIIPLFIGIFSIPFIIKGLGVEQFGILSFLWVGLSNYFGLFNFGLGQATIKFTAQSLGEKKEKYLPELVWTSLSLSFLLGILGTIAVIMVVSFLVNNVFNISAGLKDVALRSFFIAAFAVPIITIMSVARSVLEGAQRYDFLNFVKAPLNSSFFLIPVISIFLGLKLPEITFLLVAVQFLGALFYLFFCFRAFPIIKESFLIRFQRAKQLFHFGKWMALSDSAYTFLTHIDRFLIGAMVSVAAVGFYTAPFDPVARILVLPESLIVLFPVFSTLFVNRKDNIIFYYTRALKHLLLIMGVMAIIIVFFAGNILFLWLGQEFQERSTLVLQFLVLGIFGISLSLVGENLIKGYGRPDIIAKLRFLQVPFYVPALWFFISNFGIKGAAAVWMVRAISEAILIIFISFKLSSINLSILRKAGIGRALFFLLLFGGIMLVGKLFLEGLIFFGFVIFLLITFIIIWRYIILDQTDIRFFKSLLVREK